MKTTTGASVSSGIIAIIGRRLDASNSLLAILSPNGSSSSLAILKNDGGSGSTLATSSSTVLTATTSYWLRMTIEANVLTAELFTSDPYGIQATAAASVSYTLAGADATKFGSGIRGLTGMRFQTVPSDWTFDDYRIEAMNPYDAQVNVRKSAQIAKDEVQDSAFFRRNFLLTLRASDHRIQSRFQYTKQIAVTALTQLGRVYDKTYNDTYTTYIDSTGTATTQSNLMTVTNSGDVQSDPTIRLYGYMSRPVITNQANGQKLLITGTIASGDYFEINIQNHTVKDSLGVNRFGQVDPSSDWPTLEPGANILQLGLDDYDSVAKIVTYWRHAHIGH